MLTRLQLLRYKSLVDVDVTFGALTVIVGPNAAGKSNLFDAIQLLGRLGTTQTLKEAFVGHRGQPLEAFTSPNEGIKELAQQRTTSARFTFEADVQLSDNVVQVVENQIRALREGLPESRPRDSKLRQRITERRLRYRVTVEILSDSGMLRVADEKVSALRADGAENASRRPFLEKVGPRLHLRMEGQAHPSYYDLGLDHTVLSRPLYPPHYPHLTALREELSRWRVYYFDPEDMRAESPLRQSESLTPRGGDLAAFFNTLKTRSPKQFKALVQAAKFIIPAVDDVDVVRTDEGYLRLSVTESGVPYSARVVSEGTLRILGLLAITSADTPATLVAYEEPENGVHPRRLRLVAELLRRAASAHEVQLVVNTHSPVLPGYLEDATVFVCERRTGKTRFRRVSPGIWSQGEIDAALDDSRHYSERVLSGEFGG